MTTVKRDDFLGDFESANLARIAIGDGSKQTLNKVEGYYLDTIAEINPDDGKRRLLHRIALREPIGQNDEVLLWGCYQLDHTLPTLSTGTPFRALYAGKIQTSSGQPMKDIVIHLPKGAEKHPNRWFDDDGRDVSPADKPF